MEVCYPISPFVVTPFDRRERRIDGNRKRQFNKKISTARVIIERTFGQLKGRFPALHRLGVVQDMMELYRAVEAMMVMHNMCFDLHDRADGFVDAITQSCMDNGEEAYDYVAQEPDITEFDVNNGEAVFAETYAETACFSETDTGVEESREVREGGGSKISTL
ncbi:hypothetical protein FS749_015690 [Ceratobasidium sp. UAMH 11750]|nr:hypothetical protein FS749_015690 [Ceratobasidium sp. UAMH 11750]